MKVQKVADNTYELTVCGDGLAAIEEGLRALISWKVGLGLNIRTPMSRVHDMLAVVEASRE